MSELDRTVFPDILPEMPEQPVPTNPRSRSRSALAKHRQKRRDRGLHRVEVQVREEDAGLIRAVAAALADPDRASEARAVLRGRFGPPPGRSLKDLLASAPLEGVDLERPRDVGRDVDL
jgi:hypothetical protein